MRRTISTLAVLAAAFASVLSAAGATGTITGRVVDESGAVLHGAQVAVTGAGITGATDELGEFKFTSVPTGDYKVTISYVGFQDYSSDVKIVDGQTASVDVKMQVGSVAQQVLVTDERPRGEAEAINRTRVADNILQVLPAEVITSLPNANVADAVGRLPSVTLERIEGEGVYLQVRGTEPRLTNVTIDGLTVPSPEPTVRQVRLDVLPADLVESVEVNKTLAPNLDGDGIGGSVNMKTKEAGEFPTLSLDGLGGYNPILGGRGNDQFDGTTGYRFGKRRQLGLLFGGSYDYNGRGIDNEQPAIDPLSTFSKPIYDNNTIREYRYYRNRWGFGGTADYKFNQSTSIYFKSLYSNLQDYGDKWYYSPSATGAAKFYTSSKRPDASISNYALGGRKQFATSALTWEFSVARSYELDSAGNPKADFSWIGPKLTCGFDPTTQTNPTVPHFGSNCDGANSPLLNAADWGFKDITTSTGLSSQLNLTGAASYQKTYRAGSHYGILEVGGKVRNAHKFQNATENVYDGWSAASYPMTQFLNNFSSTNYMNGDYFGGAYGPVSDFNKLQTYTVTNLANFLDGYKTAADTYPNEFDVLERISAGYIMNTMEFGKWHVVAGVRFEGTQMNTRGYNVILYPAGSKNCTSATGCGFPVPVFNNPSYKDALPSLALRYALTPDSSLRMVYGRGISRPDAYQLVPYVTQDDSTNPPTAAVGNPQLKPSHANNYDLLYEKFLKPVGIVQAGFFYKQISDSLISTSYTATSGQYLGDLVSQWINAGTGQLYGFEVSWQQRLSFLPGPLGGLGMFANYSWAGSKLSGIPGRTGISQPCSARRRTHGTSARRGIAAVFPRGLAFRITVRIFISTNIRRQIIRAALDRTVRRAMFTRFRTYSSMRRSVCGSARVSPPWCMAST